MAEMARAEAVAQAMGGDTAFRAAIEAAPTVAAKHEVLNAHGFGDVSMDEMRTYAQSKGVQLPATSTGGELSEAELAAVSGGLTAKEEEYILSAAVAV